MAKIDIGVEQLAKFFRGRYMFVSHGALSTLVMKGPVERVNAPGPSL